MLTIISGLPGAGKTLYTLTHVKKYLEDENKRVVAEGKEPRKIFYHNINELALDWEALEDPTLWHECPDHSVIVIDEAQHVFARMSTGSVRPESYTKFDTHRHRGMDIFLITQNAGNIDFRVRSMCGRHLHLNRSNGMGFSTLYDGNEIFNTTDSFYKRDHALTKSQWKHPKASFEFYKSAEVHTHKVRIPWKPILMIGGSALVVLSGAAYAVSRFTGSVEQPQVTQSVTDGRGDVQIVQSRNVSSDYEPAVTGLPQTAPIYQEMYKPVSIQRIDGCSHFVFGKKEICECNDQRGNRLNTPFQVCLSFVQNGFFDFSVPDASYDAASSGLPRAVSQ